MKPAPWIDQLRANSVDSNELGLPPILDRAPAFAERTAVRADGRNFTYRQLVDASRTMAINLLAGSSDLDDARVAFQVTPGFHFVATLWGIWSAGGVAVPLALTHPAAELEHVISDADVSLVIADAQHSTKLESVQRGRAPLLVLDQLIGHSSRAESEAEPDTRSTRSASTDRAAFILYTSGTTGKPRGVVHTHDSLVAQITTLVQAWEWTADDRILLVLPLHHVHGLVNVLSCALWSGATVEMPPRFDAEATWDRLASGELTLFMAVPTIYHRLIASWDAATPAQQRVRSEGASRLRLMVSGSAALPVSTLTRWREITGHTLLERYGMTEIGMALSNPLHGERRPGSVGMPLLGVDVRLVDEQGSAVVSGTPGEIEVRAPTLFREYWRQPEATRAAFHDGWFRTGDIAVLENGMYRILGRSSVDIIKTGGYKISALEIEDVLRTHAAVADCAVVGVPDDEWGERVCAAIELRAGHSLTVEQLQHWLRDQLAPYKSPKSVEFVAALPRNVLGKVVKPDVRKLFTAGHGTIDR